jgi:hypothetical protein
MPVKVKRISPTSKEPVKAQQILHKPNFPECAWLDMDQEDWKRDPFRPSQPRLASQAREGSRSQL